MAEGWDTAVQDCFHSILSFPGSCSRKLLRQGIHSLPVGAGGCAGSCRVPGRAGTRRMELGEGAGLCSTSHPLAVPQQWQLEASPVLKDISQLQVRRDRVRLRQREPEDEVRGQRDLGGQGGGTGVLSLCSPPAAGRLWPQEAAEAGPAEPAARWPWGCQERPPCQEPFPHSKAAGERGSGGHQGWVILGLDTWELPPQPPRVPWSPVDVGNGRAGGVMGTP